MSSYTHQVQTHDDLGGKFFKKFTRSLVARKQSAEKQIELNRSIFSHFNMTKVGLDSRARLRT